MTIGVEQATHRLSSKAVARFVADGYLRLDGIVPSEVNAVAAEEMRRSAPAGVASYAGAPLASVWEESQGLGAMLRLPQVSGALLSLLGADPVYDYHVVHIIEPGGGYSAADLSFIGHKWHSDAYCDLHPYERFQVNLFYIPHDVPREMGGTMILPGSHFRKVDEIARYQNIRGQAALVCPAGTVVLFHHGLWHCAQPNLTERPRYLLKVVLFPRGHQELLWDTSDLHDPDLGAILGQNHGWEGNELGIEWMHRVKLWRHLTANPDFDLSSVCTRYG